MFRNGSLAAIDRIGRIPAALYAIFLSVLLLRCWPRLASPQVWAEDGLIVLAGFIRDGWWTFFQPVNGYWQLVGKLISAVAFAISPSQYPAISIVLSCLFAAAVGLAVALAPTLLRGRFFCALALFLLPTDIEVFGLPLYAFWWAGILLLLVALWRDARIAWGWRIAFLVLGGLSSPLIVLILPVLYLRAWRRRGEPAETATALLATAIAALQLAFMLSGDTPAPAPVSDVLLYVLPKFVGAFVLGNLDGGATGAWLAAVALFVCIIWGLRRGAVQSGVWLLLYLLAGAIALSMARVDVSFLPTHDVAPRYLFYPFVLLAWLLIQLFIATSWIALRMAIGAFGVLAMVNMLPVLTRFHVDLQWQEHLRSCRLFPEYAIPVEMDGRRAWPGWELALHGTDCARLLQRDVFASRAEVEQLPTFAFSVARADWNNPPATVEVLTNTMHGGDVHVSARPGYRIVGTYPSGRGEIRLRLAKGDSLLYRSGPDKRGQRIEIEGLATEFFDTAPLADEWLKLTFANAHLPERFVVRVVDDGDGEGQWSAVGVADRVVALSTAVPRQVAPDLP